LKNKGIGSMIYYPTPLHRQALYSSLGYCQGSLFVSEAAGMQVLSLPMYPELTLSQQEEIVARIEGFYSARWEIGKH
jgi:dTDP-4-amino-4,6-dideoxygalactose transaminase